MSRRILFPLAQVCVVTLLFAVIVMIGKAQSIIARGSIDRLAAEFEPEIKLAMEVGKIPSCTVALVADGRIVWQQAYGYSNVWSRTPAKIDSVYLIGSTFKAMSTVALLQLLEQGKFKLDDPVSPYLSEFKIQGEDAKQRFIQTWHIR
jgi:CubicO group peptidase (beta-lactamase class C family)